MKRTIAILAAAVVCAAACTKLGIPTIEFASLTGNIYPGTESTQVEIRTNLAADNDVKATLRAVYIGTSLQELGSSEIEVTIAAGETSATAEIPNSPDGIGADEIVSSVKLSFSVLPSGYVPGAKILCLLSPSTSEAIICSFSTEEADLIESLKIPVSISGSLSGNEWTAGGDMSITLELKGEGAQYVSGDAVIKVKAGENKGTLEIAANAGIHDLNSHLLVSLPVGQGVLPGDIEQILVTVRGIPTVATLGGEWKFDGIVEADELEFWYVEMEDDFELCPIHNEGFSLSFSEKDGKLALTPSSTGDFANYYRECSISTCEPKNMAAGGVVLGSCSSHELNMFVSEAYGRSTQEIYFKLSSANRSFDNSSEKLGEGVISISFISNDEIIVTIHDYDEPGFAFMWWDADKFDPEMVGFASTFKRVK